MFPCFFFFLQFQNIWRKEIFLFPRRPTCFRVSTLLVQNCRHNLPCKCIFYEVCESFFYQLLQSVSGLDEFQSTALDQFWEPLPSSQCTVIPPLFLKPAFLFFETPSDTWPRKHLWLKPRWGSERQTEPGRAPPRFRGCGAGGSRRPKSARPSRHRRRRWGSSKCVEKCNPSAK